MTNYTEQFTQDLAEVSWRDLRVHLQRDAIITIAAEVDLVEVATAVARDDKAQLEIWIAAGQVAKPSAAQLARWEQELDQPFRMLIVQPFILAQVVEHA
jgi:hypothetical protein